VPPAPAQADPLYRVLGGLAMRDLTLVESLLQVVEKLESHEEDPEQLELLFRIDHLATRMRRNSENLLVLAGHDTEGRDFEPVALLDVARAAISEITDYSRAQVTSLPDVHVIGLAADDLSHILAELLDNATSKSPQSAAVVVRGDRTGDGTLVLSVEDAGIGIPADRLADINMRLSRVPVLDASATRHMGLYVVGRLAHRHGIRVQLRERPYGGITAHIIIPDQLIRAAPGSPPDHGPRPDHPLPRPRSKPSAAPSGPVSRLSSRSGSPARPGSPAAPGAPSAPAVPTAPRFQPADPAMLPRRTPGQPPPANGMPVPGLTAPGEPAPAQPGPARPGPAQSGPAQSGPGTPAPGQPTAGAGKPAPLAQPAPGDPAAGHPPLSAPTFDQPSPGQPARPPSPVPVVREPVVREPGEARADRIRNELAGFQLGQRAARAGEAAPGNSALANTGPLSVPRRDPGPDLPSRSPGNDADRPPDVGPPAPPGEPRWGRTGRPADEAGEETDET
jgi:hypothetical protein